MKNENCCTKLNEFVQGLKSAHLPIGQGEISGYVSLDEVKGKLVLSITDGWNSYPDLTFEYCPYCGTKLQSQKRQ